MIPSKKEGQRCLELALAACRKRQSPRTGYLHFFPADPDATDTIPLYENFCFVLALFRCKTAEAIMEGKELLSRLLAFQTEEGNFPTFLHNYPKAWDPYAALKIAPVLLHLLSDFGSILGAELKDKMVHCLKKATGFSESRSQLPPLWRTRLAACQGIASTQPVLKGSEDWFEWIVSQQLLSKENSFPVPYHAALQIVLSDTFGAQEKGEPEPATLEYMPADSEGVSPRLLRDHPRQIYAALLYPFSSSAADLRPWGWQTFADQGLRILWKGEDRLHSFLSPHGKLASDRRIVFSLPEFVEGRDDLFEVAVFCDISSETSLLIEGKKGMVFQLGEAVSIQTPHMQIELVFSLLEGQGDFCGHLSRSNRPGQTACRGADLYEAYDWQIGLRTLRRRGPALICLDLKLTPF